MSEMHLTTTLVVMYNGLGYAYNGDPDDEAFAGSPGYGANPPAAGVDFFYGLFHIQTVLTIL